MRKEALGYDGALLAEAYRLEGSPQAFPTHFHDHYVIGLVEAGERRLLCQNQEYRIRQGDALLLHPGDNHACAPSGGSEPFVYLGLNIAEGVMLDWAREITGRRSLPVFSQTVIRDEAITRALRPLHQGVLSGGTALEKEEAMFRLLSTLLRRYGQTGSSVGPQCRREVELACEWMRLHLDERVTLDRLCRHTGLSKATLLRAFAREKGMPPHRYLETVRIGRAKELLAGGTRPIEAAMRTGFSDQSHFTHAFHRLIGLSPGAYYDLVERDAKDGRAD